MMRATTWLAVALSWTMTAAAVANTPVDIAPTAAYKHDPAGVTVPPALEGLQRVAAANVGNTPVVDVRLDYRGADGYEITTIYIYRSVIGSPEVWFDRARLVLMANKKLGNVEPTPTEMFAAPGAAVPNALRAVHAVEGGPMRSTAVALVPVDGWMIKLRLSSSTLDREAMAVRLDRTIAAIRWPSFAKAEPAYPMAPCAELLNIAKPARPKRSDSKSMAAGMLDALIGSIEPKAPEANDAPSKPVRWCRDALTTGGGGVYRADEAKDSYIIALGDGGVGMTVRPSLANLLEKNGKSWSVSLVQLERQIVFPVYDGIIQPQQAIALLENPKPISATTTWPERGSITITLPDK